MINYEVLAPAGNPECLDYAVMYGADAVYLAGKSFGMRAGANNFTDEQLFEAVKKAHQSNVKVYLTCNTVAREYELARLQEFLPVVSAAGVDALIISDLGVFDVARKTLPDMEIHMSTQTGVANSATANMLHQMGAARVVLARELSLEEIADIRAKTPKELEIETFVHGAMCVSFSGRCLLSNYMTGRDANRGECAQPCRWKYYLMEEKRPGEYFPVFEDGGTHILNSRDMCMIDYIPQLAKAGVSSFKIEGRAKSSYYVAVTTNAYRCAMDCYKEHVERGGSDEGFVLPQWIADEVNKVSHREYSSGFYFGKEPGQVLQNGGYVREYEVAAVVEQCGGGFITASQRNKFCVGDELEVLRPMRRPFTITAERLLDSENSDIPSTPHPNMIFKIPYDGEELPKGTLLRRKK